MNNRDKMEKQKIPLYLYLSISMAQPSAERANNQMIMVH